MCKYIRSEHDLCIRETPYIKRLSFTINFTMFNKGNVVLKVLKKNRKTPTRIHAMLNSRGLEINQNSQIMHLTKSKQENRLTTP